MLDLYPLYVTCACVFTRVTIIAIRYGTSSPSIIKSMSSGQMKPEAFQERLIALAWIKMTPKTINSELEKAMVRIGSTDRFFRFKTLTPIMPD